MSKNKIDILLPYWGDFDLFKETVESVLNQTEEQWKLLVFDDAYHSLEAQEYCKSLKDKRVTFIRHAKNIGITENFNFALKSATADYFIMLGCDDRLLPNYIKTTLNNIGAADFYQPAVEIIDKDGRVYLPIADRVKRIIRPKKPGIYRGEKLASSLCVGNWLYFPSIAWRTELVQKYEFDTKHNDTQDVILELSLIRDGARLFVDNEVTFQYRRFADSWSSRRKIKVGGRFSGESDTYNHFAEEFKLNSWHRAALSAKLHLTSRLHRILSIIIK